MTVFTSIRGLNTMCLIFTYLHAWSWTMRDLNIEPIRSVERAIQILNCFSFDQSNLAIDDIMKKTGLAKATAYRLLWTMERAGLISYDQQLGKYRLGYKALEYGGIVLQHLDIRREADPYLFTLHEQLGHSVILAVRQDDTVQYLLRYDSDEGLQPNNFVGRRRILHHGAFGILLMAYSEPAFVEEVLAKHPLEPLTPNTLTDKGEFLRRLDRILRDGYYVDEDETFIGHTAIAMPILRSKDDVIASIGISAPSYKVKGEARKLVLQQIEAAASAISRRMGYPAQ